MAASRGPWPTSVYKYDKWGNRTVVSEGAPPSNRFLVIHGESVYCAPNGEVHDFGGGPVCVNDAHEKATLLRAEGLMPSPGGRINRPEMPRLPSFKEHFYKEHGMALTEATGLVHGVPEGD